MLRIVIGIMLSSFLFGCSKVKTDIGNVCPIIDMSRYDALGISAVIGLESGEFISNGGVSLPKACVLQRVCEADTMFKERYNQSYYISLKTLGGNIVQETFPEIIAEISMGRGEEKHFNTHEFCTKISSAEK